MLPEAYASHAAWFGFRVCFCVLVRDLCVLGSFELQAGESGGILCLQLELEGCVYHQDSVHFDAVEQVLS